MKIFRKIRQDLLAQRKTRKYLKYAIGEIILVIIGILIALQINNLNNYNSERDLEREYLLSLRSEFQTNFEKIEKSIENNTRNFRAVEELLQLFDPEILAATGDQELSEKMYNVFGYGIAYQPATGVLDDIIASGKLNLILNNQLRQHLAAFKSSLAFFDIQKNFAFSDMQKTLDFLQKNGSIKQVITDTGKVSLNYQSISATKDNRTLFESAEFENYMLGYYLTIRAANSDSFLGGVRKEIDTILKEIDQEL